MDNKRCSRCHQEKPVNEYRMNGSALRATCKVCEREKDRARGHTEARKEQHRRHLHEYRKSNRRKWVAGEIEMPAMKKCPRCGETKAYHQFWKSSLQPDGLQGWCAECMAERYQEWRNNKNAGSRP
jgi:hypothetical protein